MNLIRLHRGIFLFAISNLFCAAVYAANPPPDLSVIFNSTGFFRTVTITSHDDRDIIISRVVINKRVGVKECDTRLSGEKISNTDSAPLRPGNNPSGAEVAQVLSDSIDSAFRLDGRVLHFSDQQSVISDKACNDPVQVDIYTNHGTGSYRFH